MAGKYTEELGDAWVKAFEELGAISFACDSVGIHQTTFYDWMKFGEAGREPYQEFYFKARRARAKRAGKLIRIAEDDKGGAMFLLERLFPVEFGAAGKAARDALQVLLDMVLPLMTPAAQQELLDALAVIERQRAGSSQQRMADPEASGAGAPEAIDVDGEPVPRLETGSE